MPFSGDGPGIIRRKVDAATRAALDDVANEARSRAPRLTGEYAASIRATSDRAFGDHVTGHVGSPLPQARAVERGANVGPRRGPHMRGQPSIRPAAQAVFADRFEGRMRSLPGVRAR